jgi:hypothetical protein
MSIRIAILNRSTVLQDSEVAPVVAALQRQVTEHFEPAYGYGARVIFVLKGTVVPDGFSQLVILDTSDEADDLGYHDLTAEGFPQGKSFAKSDLDGGYSWTVTLSHELLEMLADPDVNLTVEVDDAHGRPVFYSYEICDPVESDSLAYEIDGVKVSNFVLPSYFESFHKEGKRYDYRGALKGPAPALAPDGYLSVYDPASGRGWSQIYAEMRPSNTSARPRLGSRRERRRTPRNQWLRNTAGK